MNKQREELEEDYKNLLRLIDWVDNLKLRHLINPHKYEELFNDENFLRGVFHEVDGTGNYSDSLLDSSGSSLDYLLTMRRSVLPYVHYDIYELKNSHIKELGKEGWSSFLHSVGLDVFPFSNPKKVHDTDAFELILDKDEANKVVGIYNAEGYSDLLSIKDALREELVFINKSIYANAGACISNSISDTSNFTITKKVEILKKIFSWLFGRPVEYPGYRFMYEYNSDLLGIFESSGRSEASRWHQEKIGELKKEGAIIYFKLKLLGYLLQERKHGRKPDDISSFLVHYEEQTDRSERAPNSNKILLEERALEVAREWEDPLNENGNVKEGLITTILDTKFEFDKEKERRKLVGYKAKDKKKGHRQELTESTVRRRMREFFSEKDVVVCISSMTHDN